MLRIAAGGIRPLPMGEVKKKPGPLGPGFVTRSIRRFDQAAG